MIIPATYVVIDSHGCDEQMRIVISEALRQDLRAKWEEQSEFVSRLNHIPWIGPKLSWSELNRAQIQSIVAAHLTIRNEDKREDELVISGLYMSLAALVIKLEEDTGWVSMMRVHHQGSLQLEVEVSMTIGVKVASAQPKPRFRVVTNDNADGPE